MHLSDGFAVGVVKGPRRMRLLVLKLVLSLRGFEIGLETRRLSVARRRRLHHTVGRTDHGVVVVD